jgi:hypothetical protein
MLDGASVQILPRCALAYPQSDGRATICHESRRRLRKIAFNSVV